MATRRILIVDSDSKSRYALSSVLEYRGYEVVPCDSPECVASLAEQRFDAAVLEIRGNGAPGSQIARQLRRIDPALRVVFTTTHDHIQVIERDFPGAHILVKPLDIEKLFTLL